MTAPGGERTYWEIAAAQFKEHRTAVWGLRVVVALFVLATFAPVLATSTPFAVRTAEEGWRFPWFGALLDQNVFASGVDVYFNLLLVFAPFVAALWFLLPRARRRVLVWSVALHTFTFCALVLPKGIVESPLGKVVFFPQVIAYAHEKVDYLEMRKPALDLILAKQRFDLYTDRVAETAAALEALVERAAAEKPDETRKRTLDVEMAAAEEEAQAVRGALAQWKERLAEAEAAAAADKTIAIMPPIGFHHDDNDNLRVTERPIYAHAGWGTCHFLGTDQNGRDVLARILYGTRVSLTVGVIAVAIYCTVGTILGALMGFFGGWVDMLLMRFVEIMICFPTLAFILILVSVFRTRSIFLIVVGIALVAWTGAARLVRGQFLQERALDYVTAARALGIPTRRIVFKHILPNAIHPVFVTATFGVAGAILAEATLAFLGLGDARVPSWGQIMLEGRTTQKLWLILSPGVAIFLTVTVLNLVGEGVRDALDPKLRR